MRFFSLFLALGAFSGLILAGWRAPQKEVTRFLDAGLGILLGALISGRALTVAAGWSYYQSHPKEIIQVWLGGLSGVGALAGSVLAIFILASLLKYPIGLLADMFLPLAGTLAVTAWLGCWVNGCSYGWTSSAWWALPAPDEWGLLDRRVPVQLLGAIFSLLLIWLLDMAGKRFSIKGLGATLGLFGLSTVVFGLSFLRADPALTWSGLRLEAWGSAGLMFISALIVVVSLLRWKFRRRTSPTG